MTDEIKSAEGDAKAALADTKAEINKLGVDEGLAATLVKAHWVVIAGAGGFILGFATRFIHL